MPYPFPYVIALIGFIMVQNFDTQCQADLNSHKRTMVTITYVYAPLLHTAVSGLGREVFVRRDAFSECISSKQPNTRR